MPWVAAAGLIGTLIAELPLSAACFGVDAVQAFLLSPSLPNYLVCWCP
jgi:hypothetical protein